MNTMTESKVELVGLERNPELNGESVTILEYDKKEKRYIVLFVSGKKGRVKPHNIKHKPFSALSGTFSIGTASPRTGGRKQKWRPKKKQPNECTICMESMQGRVTLKCGHVLCPSCFARHSRVNNTCPYCRDVFAPEVEQRARISNNLGERMVSEAVKDYYDDDVEEELSSLIDKVIEENTDANRTNIKATVYSYLDGVCQMLYSDIDDWYDENEY